MKTPNLLPTDLILYGPPGSGKSTQAEAISKKTGAVYLKMGAVLRTLAKGKSKLAREVAMRVNAGKLVPVDLTIQIVENFLQHNAGKTIIFDGFPRSQGQAKALEKLYGDYGRKVLLIHFDVKKKDLLDRLKKRSKTEDRQDDKDLRSVARRFDIFREESKKMHKLYQGRMVKVDGTLSPAKVTAEILKALKEPA